MNFNSSQGQTKVLIFVIFHFFLGRNKVYHQGGVMARFGPEVMCRSISNYLAWPWQVIDCYT
jgi:hypothetical protein